MLSHCRARKPKKGRKLFGERWQRRRVVVVVVVVKEGEGEGEKERRRDNAEERLLSLSLSLSLSYTHTALPPAAALGHDTRGVHVCAAFTLQ